LSRQDPTNNGEALLMADVFEAKLVNKTDYKPQEQVVSTQEE